MNKIILDIEKKNQIKGNPCLAIGFFDGVHLGHQALLDEIKKMNLAPSVLTFSTTMKKEINNRYQGLLLTQDEKDEVLSSLGVENELILPFDEKVMNLTKEEFLSFLISLHPRMIVAGKDFTYGKYAAGKANDLLKLHDNGIDVRLVDLIMKDDCKISSTNIKKLLSEKQVEKANSLLGYPFFIKGEIIHGLRNGRLISFPTANMEYPLELMKLPIGVYETMTLIDGKSHHSMTNIGTHPSIDRLHHAIVETNIFGFDDEIYGKTAQISFLSFMREQKKFDSVEKLTEQLCKDKESIIKKIRD